ncbi:MAG: hypothetical protein E6K19_03155 [Methanobacteriota archaeon]|nr:MAG: hypothetical protein E6K19_03155 [Euryarchaeota archaeon]
MTVRSGHASRTKLEATVCDEMRRQGVPHAHRSLNFRVRNATGGFAKYSPAIVAHRGPVLFLVEPVPSPTPQQTIGRLTRFLEQHSPEIVLVVVTPDAAIQKVPPEAYDEIYAASDLPQMTQRIREQAPTGIVRPFPKPRTENRESPSMPT